MQLERFQACANLPSPVLTIYLNTSGTDASRHPRKRTDQAWFLDTTETLRRTLAHSDAKQFGRQVNRVRQFLEERHPAEKAVAIFAGAKTWQVVPLQVPLTNELHWGKPKIAHGEMKRERKDGHKWYQFTEKNLEVIHTTHRWRTFAKLSQARSTTRRDRGGARMRAA
jgi:hypothetical protein